MHASNAAVRSYLSRGDLPEGVTILAGDELRAFAKKVSAESGEPLASDATAVKLGRSGRAIAGFIFAVSVLGLGMIVWHSLRNGTEDYVRNPLLIAIPAILLVVISGIAFHAILHAGFSDLWLILENDGARFRVRRFIRYRVENFPLAAIDEIAIEVFPPRPDTGSWRGCALFGTRSRLKYCEDKSKTRKTEVVRGSPACSARRRACR